MPFQPGHASYPGVGRPKKGQTLKDLLRNHPIKDKRKLVQTAYKLAIAGDPRWGDWIWKVSGEAAETGDGSMIEQVRDSLMALLVGLTVEKQAEFLSGLPAHYRALLPAAAASVIEGEAEVRE